MLTFYRYAAFSQNSVVLSISVKVFFAKLTG